MTNKVVLRQGGIISSNSYFNSFYEKFYTKYTTLSSIYYSKVILESLSRCDYDYVLMLIKSFEDYIKGPAFIKNSEPDNLHTSIIKQSQSYKNQKEIDKLAGVKLLTRWFKVAAKSSIEWSSVSREWKSASKELTSTIFWQQYLGLKN